ncbi:predicted protein, partial [Nematostella vectensis]
RDGLKFYRVPAIINHQGQQTELLTTERRRKWISAISREDITDKKLANDRVCGRHFVSGAAAKDWDKHNIDWVPTLNLGHSKHQNSCQVESIAKRAERVAERRKRATEILENERREKIKQFTEPGLTVKKIFDSAFGEDGEEVPSNDMDDPMNDEVPSNDMDDPMNDEVPSNAMNDPMNDPMNDNNKEPRGLTPMSLIFSLLLLQKRSSLMNLKGDDSKVRFYTGLPSFEILMATFEFVKPSVKSKSLLSSFQEFVLVLMKLRLNVPLQDLAYRFGVSLSTVSRTFSAWMINLDNRLSFLISWPEREDLWDTMPQCFQYAFGKKTTVIIDCFEVFIERPSNLLARAQTFSNYKHHNTIKVLIGITPQGSISFVSEAWGGRTSDKYLTDNCGILKLLKPGDLVMADRGFTIEESVGLYQAKLAIPAFTRGKDQLDPVDIEKTRGIANVRIHVERVIGLLRQKYTMLQATLPIDYLTISKGNSCPTIDRIIRVCASLTNLCPSVIPFD